MFKIKIYAALKKPLIEPCAHPGTAIAIVEVQVGAKHKAQGCEPSPAQKILPIDRRRGNDSYALPEGQYLGATILDHDARTPTGRVTSCESPVF